MILRGLAAIGGLALMFAVFAYLDDPKQETRGTSDAKVDTLQAPAVWTVLRYVGWKRIAAGGIALLATSGLIGLWRWLAP